MRTLIIATEPTPGVNALLPGADAAMLPLVDRPFVQHVVERLAEMGADDVYILRKGGSQGWIDLLRDGSRWGLKITFYDVEAGRQTWEMVADLARVATDPLMLIARADTLPTQTPASDAPTVWMTGEAMQSEWSGWALVPPASLTECEGLEGSMMVGYGLAARHGGASGGRLLTCASLEGLLSSQRQVLEAPEAWPLLTGRTTRPGLRIGHNARVHPSAQIEGPVYVGENSRIGAGAILGPNTVVARDCVIDQGTTAVDTLVTPGTFIGADLEMRDVVAYGPVVANVALGAAAVISEEFLVGSLIAR